MVSLLNLKDLTHFCGVSIVDYKKLNAGLDEGQHNLTPTSEFQNIHFKTFSLL